jgi:hypothetical protein
VDPGVLSIIKKRGKQTMDTVEQTYREIAKFVSLALSVNPNSMTDGFLESAWKQIQKLPDKSKRGFRLAYPETYEAISNGINPSITFIEAIKDEISELKLTTKEDVESIEIDAEPNQNSE